MRIYEIFTSIDGEVNFFGAGRISTFIRFSGCDFENPCIYCDTKYALKLSDGKEMSVDEVVAEVKKLECKKITITGGEPLLQKREFDQLTKILWHEGFNISVETNGSFLPDGYGIGSWVVDYKLPSSGNFDKMKDENFVSLNSADYVKFVITDKYDYDKAIVVMGWLKKLGCKANFAFGPVFGTDIQRKLVPWLVRDKLFDVIVNVQIHKFLGIK